MPRRFRIRVCRGPECGEKRNSKVVYAAFQRAIAERGLDGEAQMEWQSCFGRCTQGPNCLVREEVPQAEPSRFVLATMPQRRRGRSALYNHVTEADAAAIVDEHVIGGRLVRRLIHRPVRSKLEGSE
jgi:(2Fe-2S) ferredoxin